MGQYITAAEIKTRVAGKIRFTSDDTDENAVSDDFLDEVIAEAEAEVELRLSMRYAVPFVTDDGGAFTTLPTHTQQQIKTICRLESVRRLLTYDFGRGSAVDGENYYKGVHQEYEARLERLVEMRDGQFTHFKYPPLPGLRLAAHNEAADDGFAGRVLVTGDGHGKYAAVQQNSPGETWWNGELDEI